MGSPGRPPKITPDLARLIDGMRPSFPTNKALYRALRDRGVRLGEATLYKYLKENPAPLPELQTGADLTAAAQLSDEDVSRIAEAAGDVQGGILADMRREYIALQRAIASLVPQLVHDKTASNHYARLMRARNDLAAKIVELTPRPDEGKAYLERLGEEARSRLIEEAKRRAAK